MKDETRKKLSEFNIIDTGDVVLHPRYKPYEGYLKETLSGEGMVGENSYLLLWKKEEIEELNDLYETYEFLNDVMLIGSDGGDMAYGIDIQGRYIEVPFIGMDDEELKVIANDFDDFITYVWSK